MVAFPPCKINLGLHVVRKRNDGYHEIETGFLRIPFTDALEILPSKELTFTQTGIPLEGRVEDNLCLKAYHLLQKEFDLPAVQIHLHKAIPAGAGLGGGSSDAAYTLKIVSDIFSLKLSTDSLVSFAQKLGSDCAFFIHDTAMIGKGRGELLEAVNVNLKGSYLVLTTPDIYVSTSEAYAGIIPKTSAYKLSDILELPIPEWRDKLINDFEKSIFKKYPAIEEIKNAFYKAGALYASMSGSGSTVFGIFKDEVNSKKLFNIKPTWSGRL